MKVPEGRKAAKIRDNIIGASSLGGALESWAGPPWESVLWGCCFFYSVVPEVTLYGSSGGRSIAITE